MVTSGATAPVGLAWLTAVMTLAAGLPHFQCRCPDGQVKRFLPGLGPAACCCTRACPAAPDGENCCARPPKALGCGAGACCGGRHQEAAGTGHLPAAHGPGCVKTVTAPDPLAVTVEKVTDGCDLSRWVCLPSAPAPGAAVVHGAVRGLRESHPVGPPGDLVTLHCRLLI